MSAKYQFDNLNRSQYANDLITIQTGLLMINYEQSKGTSRDRYERLRDSTEIESLVFYEKHLKQEDFLRGFVIVDSINTGNLQDEINNLERERYELKNKDSKKLNDLANTRDSLTLLLNTVPRKIVFNGINIDSLYSNEQSRANAILAMEIVTKKYKLSYNKNEDNLMYGQDVRLANLRAQIDQIYGNDVALHEFTIGTTFFSIVSSVLVFSILLGAYSFSLHKGLYKILSFFGFILMCILFLILFKGDLVFGRMEVEKRALILGIISPIIITALFLQAKNNYLSKLGFVWVNYTHVLFALLPFLIMTVWFGARIKGINEQLFLIADGFFGIVLFVITLPFFVKRYYIIANQPQD